MLAGVSFDEVIQALGYDGSVEWWPDDNLGFPMSEIIDTALRDFGILLTQFSLAPQVASCKKSDSKIYNLYTEDYVDERIDSILRGHPGLITGCYATDLYHMVAWDGENIFDPHGNVYPLGTEGAITMDHFYLATRTKIQFSRIKSWNYRFQKNENF